MSNRPLRLLLNAQPFGFGPAAAISAIAPHLLGLGVLCFAGSRHSGELQERRLFQSVQTLSPEAGPSWRQAIASCDVLVTAMDVELAMLALEMGKQVVFYDALLWFWHEGAHWERLCQIMVHPRALYLAQDFMGGRERLASLACATPVIAFRCGSVPEVVDDGVTGFIVDDEAAAVEAFGRLGELSPACIRARFVERFCARRMAQEYVGR